jgi:hypothetical protein
MSKRKNAERAILEFANDIDPSGRTTTIYQTLFKKFDDKAFDAFMVKLRDYGYIPVYIAVADGVKIKEDELLALADKLGHDFWDHIVIEDVALGEPYTTPKTYFTTYGIIRRQSQTQEHGISVADNYNVVDTMTGQTVGNSKGAGFSYPEILLAIGSDNTDMLAEFLRFRGGDNAAGREMIRSIMQEGKYHTSQYEEDTVSKSTKLMDVYFKGIHIAGNFIE